MHSSVSIVEDSNLGIVVLSMAYEMFVRVLFVDIYLFIVDNRFLDARMRNTYALKTKYLETLFFE